MSEAKEKYIKILRSGEAVWSEITNYVNEL